MSNLTQLFMKVIRCYFSITKVYYNLNTLFYLDTNHTNKVIIDYSDITNT